jgi:2-oxo-4-hydroxy-4-carboxy-5-ureidoimidazoline decarboxylase
MIDLDTINAWEAAQAQAAFLRCCGSMGWAATMAAQRPFFTEADLCKAAENSWESLSRADWLEAFAAHPKIGDVDTLRQKFSTTTEWSAQEQAGVRGAAEEVVQALADGNRAYEARFGYLFIVCASGKTAEEMLALLRQRLNHAPEEELRIAAAEQKQITYLRLKKLTP